MPHADPLPQPEGTRAGPPSAAPHRSGARQSKHRGKSDRYLCSAAAFVILVLTFIGFQPYYLRGEGFGGRSISPEIFLLVLVHGVAMSAWVLLFLVQSLLIAGRNRRLHMKLGWSALGIASATSISGFALAVRSAKSSPDFQFWGMEYRQFLLVMLMEMVVYTGFVVAGLAWRKRPEIHRAMLLLASLSILAGATVRIPALFPIFGVAGWPGIFGPIFALGAVFLLARFLVNRALDRPFAVGYAVMVALYIFAAEFALHDSWRTVANWVLGA